MELSIHVKEEVLVFDITGDDLVFVTLALEEIIKRFVHSDEPELNIRIIKDDSRAPPTLGISVSENMKIGDALR